MNKTNTTEATLRNIRSMCAERDRKECDKLRANRLDRDRREEAERERVQNTNSILNSYMDKVRAREDQQSQERNQSSQNMRDESERKRAEDAHRSQDMTRAINRGMAVAKANENALNDYMDKHKRLLDKGIEAVKREQNKTYFS